MVHRPIRIGGMDRPLYIGCAGWKVPAALAGAFPPYGSHLERSAAVFNTVEINSSFYRPHREATWEKWGKAVPTDFRFSVKFPKAVTHASELRDLDAARAFLTSALHLGSKLGAILVQLPPSLSFDETAAGRFFECLRKVFGGMIACEPREASWFGKKAQRTWEEFQIARVAADPSPIADGKVPGGWDGAVYYRLHGSPQRYYSSYDGAYLTWLSDTLRDTAVPTWCIFDNTARDAAPENALQLMGRLARQPA